MNVSRFFQAYRAPPKIILQVYVALLRAVQGESKGLLRMALDILTPALPRRLEHNPNDAKCPIWIRYTKKVLLEEGHSVVHLVHIWQLVIRHADLFYVARGQFIPIMVTSLSRIGMQSNISTECRRVALDLAKLIISRKREQHLVSACPPEPKRQRTLEVQKSCIAQSMELQTEFRPNTAMLHVTVSFLTQLPFRPMKERERELVARRCVALMDDAMQYCASSVFKLPSFERFLESADKFANQLPQTKSSSSSGAIRSLPSCDGKSALQSKIGPVRNEKVDSQRVDRIGHRRAVLLAVLELSVVFTRRQCTRFVENNSTLLLSLVPAALNSRDPVAAKCFNTIVVNVLKGFPAVRNECVGPKVSPAAKEGKSETSVLSFLTCVQNSIESALRSEDVAVNYCGLLVLSGVLSERP